MSLDRLERWVAGFVERHGEVAWSLDGTAYLLTGADGSWARLTSWTPPGPLPPDLLSWGEAPNRLGFVLIRRGGYAVGVAHGEALVAHKCGTKYVQSRTAAGGWSQQRYARRRSNQAHGLVDTVVERVVAMFAAANLDGLVVGGDKQLVAQVLGDTRMTALGQLPRREFFDMNDPRFAVLERTLVRTRSVEVTVCNSP